MLWLSVHDLFFYCSMFIMWIDQSYPLFHVIYCTKINVLTWSGPQTRGWVLLSIMISLLSSPCDGLVNDLPARVRLNKAVGCSEWGQRQIKGFSHCDVTHETVCSLCSQHAEHCCKSLWGWWVSSEEFQPTLVVSFLTNHRREPTVFTITTCSQNRK